MRDINLNELVDMTDPRIRSNRIYEYITTLNYSSDWHTDFNVIVNPEAFENQNIKENTANCILYIISELKNNGYKMPMLQINGDEIRQDFLNRSLENFDKMNKVLQNLVRLDYILGPNDKLANFKNTLTQTLKKIPSILFLNYVKGESTPVETLLVEAMAICDKGIKESIPPVKHDPRASKNQNNIQNRENLINKLIEDMNDYCEFNQALSSSLKSSRPASG